VKDGQVTWPPPLRNAPVTATGSQPASKNAGDASQKYPLEPAKTVDHAASMALITTKAATTPAPKATATTALASTAPPLPKKASSHAAPAGSTSMWPLLLAGVALVLVGVAAP